MTAWVIHQASQLARQTYLSTAKTSLTHGVARVKTIQVGLQGREKFEDIIELFLGLVAQPLWFLGSTP